MSQKEKTLSTREQAVILILALILSSPLFVKIIDVINQSRSEESYSAMDQRMHERSDIEDLVREIYGDPRHLGNFSMVMDYVCEIYFADNYLDNVFVREYKELSKLNPDQVVILGLDSNGKQIFSIEASGMHLGIVTVKVFLPDQARPISLKASTSEELLKLIEDLQRIVNGSGWDEGVERLKLVETKTVNPDHLKDTRKNPNSGELEFVNLDDEDTFFAELNSLGIQNVDLKKESIRSLKWQTITVFATKDGSRLTKISRLEITHNINYDLNSGQPIFKTYDITFVGEDQIMVIDVDTGLDVVIAEAETVPLLTSLFSGE